jgi:hypothetical protein
MDGQERPRPGEIRQVRHVRDWRRTLANCGQARGAETETSRALIRGAFDGWLLAIGQKPGFFRKAGLLAFAVL